MINDKEFETIKSQVSRVLQYSQNTDNPKIDELMDNWRANKAWLIEKMDGLIYEVPEKIKINIDDLTKKSKAINFRDWALNSIRVSGDDCLDRIESLGDFLWCNRINFFSNKTEEEFNAYKKNMLIGYDRKKESRIYNPGSFFDPKDYDETRILYSPSSVVSLYRTSILDGDSVGRPKFTKLVQPTNMTSAYETAKRHTFNATDKEMHTIHNIPITDLVGFHTGGHSKDGRTEFLGDNHISLIFNIIRYMPSIRVYKWH